MIIDRSAGSFETPDVDDELVALSASWQTMWGLSEPTGDGLRHAYESRWVRFHTLPEARRRARDERDRVEIDRRQREVLSSLSTRPDALLAIAEDWDENDGAAGWSAEGLPGRRAWRHGSARDPQHTDGRAFFWVDLALRPERSETLLSLAADGVAHVLIAPPELDWLYAPYEGGVDVFVVDTTRRESLRARLGAWLSARADGL